MPEYIEREALLDDISAAVDHGGVGRVVGQTLMRYAKRIPAADVAPVVHGRWNDTGSGIIICSECGRGYNLVPQYTHYCPNCGAKMDGGADHAAD